MYVSLVSDTAGVDAATVAHLVRRAQLAARDGFAEAGPFRRRAPPWLTAQVATGAYLGGTPEDESDTQTGGLGGTLLVGVRGQRYSARLSATASTGFLFDNSERWEVAALIGVVTEAADGRVRLGLSAGPGLAGGRESNSCFLFCGGYEREQIVLPTRIGLSVLGEAYVFVAPPDRARLAGARQPPFRRLPRRGPGRLEVRGPLTRARTAGGLWSPAATA